MHYRRLYLWKSHLYYRLQLSVQPGEFEDNLCGIFQYNNTV